jgi:hypothetical protein
MIQDGLRVIISVEGGVFYRIGYTERVLGSGVGIFCHGCWSL